MHIITQLNSWGQKKRAIWFAPILKFLTKLGFTANMLTLLRAFGGPFFLFLFPLYPRAAVIMLLIVQLGLDSVDGALARHQKKLSDRGKFWDVLVDHSNYLFGVLTLVYIGGFSEMIISYHLFIVPILFLLATIKESEKTKSNWLIHPYYTTIYFKPLASLALILYVFQVVNVMDVTLLVLNVAMTIWTLYYGFVLVKRWK